MNSNPSTPRLVCQVVRHWFAVSDARDSRHVAGCADCQAFYRAAQNLDVTLRRAAAASPVEVSPDLEDRILEGIRPSADPENARRRSRSNKPRGSSSHHFASWATGLAVAGLAITVVWWNRPPSPPDSGAVTAAETTALVNTVQILSNRLVDTVLPSTGEFVANNPLQQEFDSIYEDARSALGFLALNFLPGQPEKVRPRSG